MPSTHLHAVQISKVIYPSRLEAEEVARMYGAVEGMLESEYKYTIIYTPSECFVPFSLHKEEADTGIWRIYGELDQDKM